LVFRSLQLIMSIAFRSLRRRSWRTSLLVFGLTLTIASCISIGSVVTSIRAQVSEAQLSGRQAGYPYYSDFIVTGFRYWYEIKALSDVLLDDSHLHQMKSIEGIETIESYIGSYVPLQLGFWGDPCLKSSKGNTTSLDAFIMIIGVDPEMEAERWRIGSRMKIIEGDFLESGKESCAVIGIKFAETNGINVGDELILPSGLFSDSNMFSFKEEVRLKIVGIYWTGTEYDKLIITDLNTLQRGLGLDDAFVCAFITLKPEANATSVLDRLWNINGLDILVPARGKAYFTESLGFGSYAIPEPTKQMTIANFQTIITSLITTGLFVSASFFSSVRERQWEVGLLKGIGFSPAFIKIELIIEALIVGSISGLLGFITSFILAVISNTIASGLIPTIFFNMTLSHAAFSVSMSVFLSVLSSYFPALLASDASPIEALRR